MSTHLEELLRRARSMSNERTNSNVAYISRASSRNVRRLVTELADALQGLLNGPALCVCCGEKVAPGEQAYHLKEKHSGPHIFYLDAREFSIDRPSMTVGELKRLTGCSIGYQLYMEHEGVDGDVAVHDGEAVCLTQRPHFFNVPPATY